MSRLSFFFNVIYLPVGLLRRVISWHSLDHICTIVSVRSFVSGVWSRTEPRARTLYVYNISNLEIYHCHSFSDTAKPAVCRRPKIVSFNDLSGFCWIQRMSRERIKGRQTTEIEAKVKMRRLRSYLTALGSLPKIGFIRTTCNSLRKR